MQPLPQYALPAIVLVTALGALVTAFVMFKYGRPAPSDEDADAGVEGDDDEASREFVSMVRRERAARRDRATRVGQTVAVACFAAASILAVIPLVSASRNRPQGSGVVAAPPADAGAPASEARPRDAGADAGSAEPDMGSAALKEAHAQLEQRVQALEERVAAAEAKASQAPAAAPYTEPAAKPAPDAGASPSLPSRGTEPPARPAPRPRERSATGAEGWRQARDATPSSTTTSALPRVVAATTTVGNVRLEILRAPERATPGTPMTYTVRLSDLGGAPLTGAEVAVVGRMSDGSTAQTALEPTAVSGTYSGALVVTPQGPSDLRLRVARRQTTFELPLASPAAW